MPRMALDFAGKGMGVEHTLDIHPRIGDVGSLIGQPSAKAVRTTKGQQLCPPRHG